MEYWECPQQLADRCACGQAAELDRGHTCAPKFPGAPRRDLTRNRVKGPNFSGAARRNPANGAKRSKFLRRYAPGDSPPVTSQISPHIFNMSLQPCFAAWQAARGPHEPY